MVLLFLIDFDLIFFLKIFTSFNLGLVNMVSTPSRFVPINLCLVYL
jgi:hypothetical protein